MTDYHVAVDHLVSPDPDTPGQQVETTYLGVVDQAHADEVRAIAALEDSPRFVKEHPHIEGAFMVLRDDGDLDVYVPVGASEYRIYEADPAPKADQAPDGATEQDLPRGASGPAYIDGAIRFGSQVIGGAMDYPGNPPRVTEHTTESPAGKSYFYSVAAYLIRVGAEPQVIYDPVSDLLGQFGPLNKSARALKNDGSRRTNREGKVNIQLEVLGRAASPWTKGFDKSKKPNYRKFEAACRAHGVPDVWPAGKPAGTATAAAKGARSRTTWQTKGGYFAHSQVPGNDHWDPGAIDTSIVPGTPSGPPVRITPKSRESATTVQTQVTAALKSWPFIPEVEKTHGLPAGLLLAVGSRETNLTNKVGDHGHGFGVWQRDNRWWPVDDTYLEDIRRQAEDAAALLATNYKALKDWGAAVAAYNAGLTGVQSALAAGKSSDSVTTGGDYAADVLGRLLHVQAATATATSPKPQYEPFPGSAFFHGGRNSPIITAMGRRLVAEGCGKYRTGPGPNWTNADKTSFAAWQRKYSKAHDLGWSEADCDGIPGKTSWDALKVPKV